MTYSIWKAKTGIGKKLTFHARIFGICISDVQAWYQKNLIYSSLQETITSIEIAKITPNEPNQLSETYSTKSSLADKNNPIIITKTIRDSNFWFN